MFVSCLLSLAAVGVAVANVASCGSSSDGGTPEDAALDIVQYEDVGNFEEPVFDPDSAVGRVILLKPYDPKNRCFGPPTAVGHPDELPGGGIAPCGTSERCYRQKNGTVFYAEKDCVHGTNFLFNVDDMPYTDLTDCEPVKHLESQIKDCPNPSCTYARDVHVDLLRSCATEIVSRACRDTTNTPTSCFCDSTKPAEAFVAFDGKSTTNVPAGFTPCDATTGACKKALAMADSVQGCPPDAVSDAGGD